MREMVRGRGWRLRKSEEGRGHEGSGEGRGWREGRGCEEVRLEGEGVGGGKGHTTRLN